MTEPDTQRFERLYRENFERVAAYLLSRADRGLAEDALGRTFEIAWRRLADVPAEPLPWLLGVARRALADLRRGQGRQNALIERIAGTLGEGGEDHTETLTARGRVFAALQSLTESQREVLLLVAWDGLSQREAAAALGCSRGAVALRLHRARARIKAASAEEQQTSTTKPAAATPGPLARKAHSIQHDVRHVPPNRPNRPCSPIPSTPPAFEEAR